MVKQRIKRLRNSSKLYQHNSLSSITDEASQELRDRVKFADQKLNSDRQKTQSNYVLGADISHRLDVTERSMKKIKSAELLDVIHQKDIEKKMFKSAYLEQTPSLLFTPRLRSPHKFDFDRLENLTPKLKEEIPSNLAPPSGRRDATRLVEWLNRTVTKLQASNNQDLKSLFKNAQQIYTVCFEEALRQVSVHCKERGLLIRTVWDAYLGLLEKALKTSKEKNKQEKAKFQTKLKNTHEMYRTRIANIVEDVTASSTREKDLKQRIKKLETTIDEKTKKTGKLINRLEQVQYYYENTRKKMLELAEHNRILKIRIENEESDFSEDENGNIVKRPRVHKKFKQKTENVIAKEVLADPILRPAELITKGDGYSFTKEVEVYDKEQTLRFTRDDFQDAETDTSDLHPVDENETQTWIDDVEYVQKTRAVLPGAPRRESIIHLGFRSKDLVDRTKLDNLEMIRISEWLTEMEEIMKSQDELSQEFIEKCGEFDKKLLMSVVFKNNIKSTLKSITDLKDLIQARDDSKLDAPLSFTLLPPVPEYKAQPTKGRAQKRSIRSKSIMPVKTPSFSTENPIKNLADITALAAQKRPGFVELELSQLQEDTSVRLHAKKKDKHLADVLLGKLTSMPVSRIKKVLNKRILLKQITGYYTERRQAGKSILTNQDFSKFIYDLNIQKYGAGNLVEQKFVQIVSSCIKYKKDDCLRINLFSRFLGVGEKLGNEELDMYCDFIGYTERHGYAGPGINRNDYDAVILTPFTKAMDFAKLNFESTATVQDYSKFRQAVEGSRKQHKNHKLGLVDIDAFMIHLIDLFTEQRDKQKAFVQVLFDAADLNQDGYLQYLEAELLVRHISEKAFDREWFKKLFKTNSDMIAVDEETTERAITFDSFAKLAVSNQIFTQKGLSLFSGTTSQEEDKIKCEEIAPDIDNLLNIIISRFNKVESDLYDDTIDIISEQIENPENPTLIWLAYRLMDEESKRILVEHTVETMLPKLDFLACNTSLRHHRLENDSMDEEIGDVELNFNDL